MAPSRVETVANIDATADTARQLTLVTSCLPSPPRSQVRCGPKLSAIRSIDGSGSGVGAGRAQMAEWMGLWGMAGLRSAGGVTHLDECHIPGQRLFETEF